jgi:hypothetical protein
VDNLATGGQFPPDKLKPESQESDSGSILSAAQECGTIIFSGGLIAGPHTPARIFAKGDERIFFLHDGSDKSHVAELSAVIPKRKGGLDRPPLTFAVIAFPGCTATP